MKAIWFILASVCVIALASCGSGGGQGDIPTQPFTNALTAIHTETGELTGRILFPSEYAQHSIRFSLGAVTFVTHPDGRFHITRVPAGKHRLQVRMKGYEPVRRTLTISGGGQMRLNPVRLVQARGWVLGRLVNQKGRSARGLTVNLDPEGGVTVTDNDGIFQFLGVSAGEHVFRVRDSRYFAGNKRFALIPNEKKNLGNIMVYRLIRTNQPTARLEQ